MIQLKCDVLVVGGGLAGCWAAIKAKETASSVVLVERGKVSKSGKSAFSGAGILCPSPNDDLDAWRKEIVVRGSYLADQDVVDALLQEQPARIKDMEDWGLTYERDDKGNLMRVGGLGGITTKIVTVSSEEMMRILRKRMEAIGVTILDRVFVTGLLTSDGNYPTKGSVTGSYGFNTHTGEPYVINAGATVLACGAMGYYYFHGEGIAMGYRAGAELWGMEFTRCMDIMSFQNKYTGIHLITYQRLGMRLYNRLGERFMERYYPEQKENTTRQQMAFATIMENLEGRGPVYADMTHLDKDSLNKLRTLPSTAPRVRAIEREDIDFGKDRILFNVHSGFINAESGGIKHSPFGDTNVPGLYVAGETGGLPANGTGTIPLKLASCCIEGHRAGDKAARYALAAGRKPLKKAQISLLEDETFRPLRTKTGMAPEELMDKIYDYLRPALVAIFRTEAPMKALLKEHRSWVEAAGALKAADWHALVKVHQKRSYVDCVGLVFEASIKRQETRGMNLRMDYPDCDNAGWLKHVILKSESDGMRVRYEPLPMDRYKVKPEAFTKTPSDIQWPRYLINEKNK